MKVTNISKGPRGLNAESGPVLVEPGQSVDVEMSAAEQKVSKATGWFEFGKSTSASKTGAGGDLSPADKAAKAKLVLAMADDETVHFKTFEAKAKEVLGADTPDKKDDIVQALQAVAGQG